MHFFITRFSQFRLQLDLQKFLLYHSFQYFVSRHFSDGFTITAAECKREVLQSFELQRHQEASGSEKQRLMDEPVDYGT